MMHPLRHGDALWADLIFMVRQGALIEFQNLLLRRYRTGSLKLNQANKA
jgi:hypothetical protein